MIAAGGRDRAARRTFPVLPSVGPLQDDHMLGA
ncbi:hypothetical protein BCO71033_02684 [Burkholderia contaminans]|uniref:Uncharacterized protein n=1 Tax=Burkholderia contaminans TaxID=488447 RepID=A0A6P2Y1R6_9BURK|nr:hypothetical protein BCO71033_02684 [Burkholderia contaminans]